MRMLLAILLIVEVTFAVSSAQADAVRAETLLSTCYADKRSAQYGYCVGFIVGVAEKMADFGLQRSTYGDGTAPRPLESICPDGAPDYDASNLVPLFINWAANHPEEMNGLASFAVGNALQTKWPCHFSK